MYCTELMTKSHSWPPQYKRPYTGQICFIFSWSVPKVFLGENMSDQCIVVFLITHNAIFISEISYLHFL